MWENYLQQPFFLWQFITEHFDSWYRMKKIEYGKQFVFYVKLGT